MKRLLALNLPPDVVSEAVEHVDIMRIWDGVQLPGTMIEDERQWLDLLDAYRIPPVSVAGIVADSLSRFLPEADDRSRNRLIGYLKETMARMASFEIHYLTLDLGLNRVGGRAAVDLEARCELLRSLLKLADAHELTLCIPLRIPACDPLDPKERFALQLVNEIMHPCCRLVLDIFPEELPPDFDPKRCLKDYHYSVAEIRLHYEPALGIRLDGPTVAAWAKAVRWHNFRGLFVFSPVLSSAEQLLAENRHLEQLMREHWDAVSGDE